MDLLDHAGCGVLNLADMQKGVCWAPLVLHDELIAFCICNA